MLEGRERGGSWKEGRGEGGVSGVVHDVYDDLEGGEVRGRIKECAPGMNNEGSIKEDDDDAIDCGSWKTSWGHLRLL